MEIAFGNQSTEDIFIELFDTATATRTAAPVTVDNFLNYVEDSGGNRRYDGTFLHRSVPGFVLQGGGFYFDAGQGPVAIPTDNPIVNEFDVSRPNVRGTIAMAKTPVSPDTATSQWFFNLADNNDPGSSTNLDTQNGGFTVFGRVIGNGMQVVDSIAALPVTNLPLTLGGTPSPIPYTSYNDGRVDNANLLQVSRIEIYQIPQSATLSASERNQLDFGDAGPGLVQEIPFSVANLGMDALNFSLRFTGPAVASFTTTTNCGTLQFGESCSETLSFNPATPGLSEAQLEISSNDPNTPVLVVPAIGYASGDNDGVPDAIEAAGPNNGDANGDGISDVLQDYVTSFVNTDGAYVTLETAAGLRLNQVRAVENPSPLDTPEVPAGTLRFEHGFYGFNIDNIGVGGSATVTMTLPGGSPPTHYFKHGLLPGENPSLVPAHWYLFNYDGTTGAEFQGNRVVLHFVDGGRGDADGQANGVIVDPGGPSVLVVDSGSGGGGCSALPATAGKHPFPADFALLLSGLFVLRRNRRRIGARA